MYDCHLHSNFSTDSTVSGELFCHKAIEIGLSGIAFTDHLDYDYPEYEDQFDFDKDAYSINIDCLKEEYKGDLKVLKGIEIGIQPHVIEKTNKTLDKYSYDYVLCSVHIIDGVDPYLGKYYLGKSRFDAYEGYLKELLYAITHFDNFDMLGHIDYIIRCAHYEDRSLRYHDHMDILDMILKTLISKGKGFEINTGSYRESSTYPPLAKYDTTFLKRYKELGGELLCLGSDAHNLEYVGYKFDFFKDLVKDAGFEYLVHFENRKPVFRRV